MAFSRIVEVSIGPTGQLGTTIRDLRITFSINKTQAESENTAEIMIYNLKKETADKVGVEGNKVILRAGYEDEGVKNLFFGDITRVQNKKEGTETVLTIEAKDGVESVVDSNIILSYDAGTLVKTVIDEITNTIGLPIGNQIIYPTTIYNNGYAFIGKATVALTEVLNFINKKWTIQNEQLIIYEDGETILNTGLKLTSSTGLIGQPEKLVDEDGIIKWNVQSLLFPQLVPGSQIEISSDAVNGFFNIETSAFSGDNFDSDFAVTCEVSAI